MTGRDRGLAAFCASRPFQQSISSTIRRAIAAYNVGCSCDTKSVFTANDTRRHGSNATTLSGICECASSSIESELCVRFHAQRKLWSADESGMASSPTRTRVIRLTIAPIPRAVGSETNGMTGDTAKCDQGRSSASMATSPVRTTPCAWHTPRANSASTDTP